MDYDSDDDYLDLDSDQEPAIDSSEDEIDIVLHGTPEQKRKLDKRIKSIDSGDEKRSKSPKAQGQKVVVDDEDSSEDEFEKEMAADLDFTMTTIQRTHKIVATPGGSTSQQMDTQPARPTKQKTTSDFYDNDYFDSDSDDDGTSEQIKAQKRTIPSNDDLLYDPEADANDQKWVDAQRRRYQPTQHIRPPSAPLQGTNSTQHLGNAPGGATGGTMHKLPSSDAILNCPACMVQLCLDCQRHETYHNQYRAMFVMNCSVNYEQRLNFPRQQRQSKKKKRKNQATSTTTEDHAEESYHPVKCSQCATEVGVFDSEEVFHFFNVLSSHS